MRATIGFLVISACGAADHAPGPDASVSADALDARVSCSWVVNDGSVLGQLPTALDGIVGDPVVIREGDAYTMFYGAIKGDFSQPETVRIFRATSVDGVTWNRSSTPVIVPGTTGKWDAAAVETPSVIKGPD